MPKNTNSRFSKLKRRAQEKFPEVNRAVSMSERNIWARDYQRFEDSTTVGLIQFRFQKMLYAILPALIAKKGQREAALMKLARKNEGIDVDALLSNKKKPDNKYLAFNVFAWPYAVSKMTAWLLNMVIDAVDQTVSHLVLKLFKRLTPEYYQNNKGERFELKIQDLIDNIKKTGSLPARVIKYLINFVEIILETILSAPIHVGREFDAWLDKRAESTGEKAASNVINTAVPATAPAAVEVRATVEASQSDSQNTIVVAVEQKGEAQPVTIASALEAALTQKPGHQVMVTCPPTPDGLRKNSLFAKPPSNDSEPVKQVPTAEPTGSTHHRTSSAAGA
jgi:hypothetical protein